MMEDKREGREPETTESDDVQPDIDESTLSPEERARRLFASYLTPAVQETAPVMEPSPAQPGEAAPEDESDLSFLGQGEVGGEPEDLPDAAEGEGRRAWYVIHSYSGYEGKVKRNLEHRIESLGVSDKIFEVVVPTEEEIEVKDGQRRSVERRIFPGYILVEMIMDKDSWHVVRNTPGVTGFVGSVNKPSALPRRDVDRILKRMRSETPKVKVSFRPGQKVRISDGPFEDFVGAVDAIYPDKGKVRILVSFFGRETPVELDFLQVEKIG
jgi:transcriptional antiterminator NusG